MDRRLFVRMAKDLNLLVSFILLIYNTVSRAEDTVYVETGASVRLDIEEDQLPAELDEFYWEKDKTNTLMKYYNGFKRVKLSKVYEGRVDFNNKTFSLTLKNMQKTDSGIYAAKTIGETNNIIAAHTVSVIDAAEAPVLTTVPYWSSHVHCTVNVTCTGHHLIVNSTNINGVCPPDEVTSHEKFTLSLICSGESIICNHSNPVSWKTDTRALKSIQQLCESNEETAHSASSHNYIVIVIVVVLGGVIVFCGLILSCYFRNKKGDQKNDNLDYDDVEIQKQKMSEDTWTTVIYQRAGQRPCVPENTINFSIVT